MLRYNFWSNRFDIRQGLRFDWLRTIELEIDQIEEANNPQETEEEDQKPIRHIRESIANSPEKYNLRKIVLVFVAGNR